jgi:regulator of protease activity HflC (stomatin/prohibitin superfamily)
MLRKFLVFFLAFFILAVLLQVLVFKSDQEIIIIMTKTFISGLVAAGVFLLITKNK